MLSLKDFFHLPEIDPLFEQITSSGPGLRLVAGLDPRPALSPASPVTFLPSGRSALFQILMEDYLEKHPGTRCTVVALDRAHIRVPRHLKRRVRLVQVSDPTVYGTRILSAAGDHPDLLVVDKMVEANVLEVLEAGRRGLRVLSQLDSVFYGRGVVRQLVRLGVAPESLAGLAWILAVQRMPVLCHHCRQPVEPDEQLSALFNRYGLLPSEDPSPEAGVTFRPVGDFYQAGRCPICQGSGRHGDVAVFDVFQHDSRHPAPFDQPSLLPIEVYVLRLAQLGHLPVDDVLHFEIDQFHRTFNLLVAEEQVLQETNASLERKLAELETAHTVLEQRTRSLVALQEIGQALIGLSDLDELAARVCSRARELCRADRAILYYLGNPEQIEVLAVGGWPNGLVHQRLPREFVFKNVSLSGLQPYPGWPPGVPHQQLREGESLRTGISVPLIAQDQLAGLMIVHSTQRPAFTPGEQSLLQTFANQAALAIQRAGLIEQLRQKILELEAAQHELAKKERMEHELALARQVQQSVLPRVFPHVRGYQFAASNEPARQVGGDFYDVILLDDQRFGFAVADVSDKGMPAALYMALSRSLLLAEARRQPTPSAAVTSVNELLLELGEPGMFVTLFYGVVDPLTRRMRYVRAGQDPPLLLRGGSGQWLVGHGTPLGIVMGAQFEFSEEEVELLPGDRLVLYTDGLVDTLSPTGELFGRERLKALLEELAGLPANRFCQEIFSRLVQHQGSGDQYDDMTVLVVDVGTQP